MTLLMPLTPCRKICSKSWRMLIWITKPKPMSTLERVKFWRRTLAPLRSILPTHRILWITTWSRLRVRPRKDLINWSTTSRIIESHSNARPYKERMITIYPLRGRVNIPMQSMQLMRPSYLLGSWVAVQLP